MEKLIVFAIVGFIGQLLDGSLGMSSGLTATSFLLAVGIAPAIASTSIHLAELVTTASSGVSHLRFGNIDKRLVRGLIIPGCIGGFIGAGLLSHISGEFIKPYISGALLVVGFYILYVYIFDKKKLRPKPRRRPKTVALPNKYFLYPLAFCAGLLDAIGGGGWGPLNTPVLISQTGMKPRNVIGSVDASEFAVALSTTIGFFLFLGLSEVNWAWAAALAAGGMIAAPIAAWIVKILPSFILGCLVGGVIILTSTKTLLTSLESTIPTSSHDAIYASLVTMWILSSLLMIWKRKFKKSQK